MLGVSELDVTALGPFPTLGPDAEEEPGVNTKFDFEAVVRSLSVEVVPNMFLKSDGTGVTSRAKGQTKGVVVELPTEAVAGCPVLVPFPKMPLPANKPLPLCVVLFLRVFHSAGPLLVVVPNNSDEAGNRLGGVPNPVKATLVAAADAMTLFSGS